MNKMASGLSTVSRNPGLPRYLAAVSGGGYLLSALGCLKGKEDAAEGWHVIQLVQKDLANFFPGLGSHTTCKINAGGTVALNTEDILDHDPLNLFDCRTSLAFGIVCSSQQTHFLMNSGHISFLLAGMVNFTRRVFCCFPPQNGTSAESRSGIAKAAISLPSGDSFGLIWFLYRDICVFLFWNLPCVWRVVVLWHLCFLPQKNGQEVKCVK